MSKKCPHVLWILELLSAAGCRLDCHNPDGARTKTRRSVKMTMTTARAMASRQTVALAVTLCWAGCGAASGVARRLDEVQERFPLVINTWPFVSATEAAWAELEAGGSRLDAVERGCATCEAEQCDGSVGFGSVPDSTGEVTLDALIMDGPSHDAGAVACLRGVREAVSVARSVMTHTAHTMLVGEKASQFARMMGFEQWQGRSETTNSLSAYLNWQNSDCQPNFFRGLDGGNTSCPPYPAPAVSRADMPPLHQPRSQYGLGQGHRGDNDHDTIGMIALDADGEIALATSTNGANHKIAGRVGDTPVIGSGGYLENEIGAAVGTGDGDILMRFSPAARAVWAMGAGMSPTEACEAALRPIGATFPDFCGALVCADKAGSVGAAVWGCGFSYSWRRPGMEHAEVVSVPRMDGDAAR